MSLFLIQWLLKVQVAPNSTASTPKKRKFVEAVDSNEFLPKLQSVWKAEDELSSDSHGEEGKETKNSAIQIHQAMKILLKGMKKGSRVKKTVIKSRIFFVIESEIRYLVCPNLIKTIKHS